VDMVTLHVYLRGWRRMGRRGGEESTRFPSTLMHQQTSGGNGWRWAVVGEGGMDIAEGAMRAGRRVSGHGDTPCALEGVEADGPAGW